MIRLTCTQCKAELEMDDAFAGGVCRCQYCGTIQTVPSHLKSVAATPAGKPQPAARTLYNKVPAGGGGGGSNSGLYEIANAVGGGSPSGDQQRRPAARPQPPARAASPVIPTKTGLSAPVKIVIFSSVGVVVALVGVILWLVMGHTVTPAQTPPAPVAPTVIAKKPTPAPTPAPPANPVVARAPQPAPAVQPPVKRAPTPAPAVVPAVAGPNFLKVPIKGDRVAYLVDRNERIRPYFTPLKESLFKSVESLTSNRDFVIIWWKKTNGPNPNQGIGMPSFPKKNMVKAIPDQVTKCRNQFEKMMIGGKTRVNEAIEEAMARRPDAIVIVTARGNNLDSDFEQAMQDAIGDRKLSIYAFTIGDSNGSTILKSLAEKSGGIYTEISSAAMLVPATP